MGAISSIYYASFDEYYSDIESFLNNDALKGVDLLPKKP